MILTKPNGNQIAQVERMYEEYFPIEERKSFKIMTDNEYIDLLCLVEYEQVMGFCFMIRGNKDILLDYLAVNKEYRSGGIGAKILQGLIEYYTEFDGIYIEIERLNYGDSTKENDIRIRRHNFYLNNGFIDSNIFIKLMGVDMQILYLNYNGGSINYEQYLCTYRNALTDKFIEENIKVIT